MAVKGKYIIGFILILLLMSCASSSSTTQQKSIDSEILEEKIRKESEALTRANRALRNALESKNKVVEALEPVVPEYDPLDDFIVSFSMVNEDFQVILYSLSKSVGMNLIIDPKVKKEENQLTLNFDKVPASTVLKEILHTIDLYYVVEQNVIRVMPYQERTFLLNFLDSELTTTFDVGGDVLGAGETETAGGLSGSFRLSGSGSSQGNAYDIIEEMVKRVLSEGGKYSLNRMSGSLYIKDTPAVIRSASRLINHLKEMMSRQILIEARIIEVALSDEHRYGIDWSAIRDEAASFSTVSSAAWSLGNGLILSHQDNEYTLATAIDALDTFGETKIISNPSIRSKHGKPALISVGTSFTYKKSVETTTTTNAGASDTTTEVEVSTVFDGLILGVIPFIENHGQISLLINPIKSDVDRESLVPEAVGPDNILSISLPEVRIKEISTTISLANNDVIILGGLIDKREVEQNRGVPFLSSIPVLGYLFKNEIKTEQISELVIVLSVSIV